MENQLFTNQAISINDIPQYQQVEQQPMEKSYKKVVQYNIIICYSILLIALIALFAFNKNWWKPLPIGVVACIFLALLLVTFFWCFKALQYKAYAIREKDILYTTGWLFQKTHIVPYNKIQHCSVAVGPIEKYYQLATLKIYTAASNNIDIAIRGLSKEKAEHLKDWLMQNNTTDEQL